MTPLQIRDAVISYLADNWTATPIAWQNRPFDPAGIPEWIRPVIVMGGSSVGENAVHGAGWRNGVLIISVFTEKNSGERKSLDLAGSIEALFGMDIVSGVIFDQPETKVIGAGSDAWFQVNVSIPFSAVIDYT